MASFDVQGALAAGHSLSDIANEMGQHTGFDAAGARQAGYTDQQIIDTINAGRGATAPAGGTPPAAPDTSFSGGLGYGIRQAGTALGQTGQFIGHETGWQGLEDAGKSLQTASAAPAGATYQPTDIGASLANGDLMGAVKQLPRAAVEAAPQLAGVLGGAAAADAVGIPVALGAAGASALGSLGHDVYGAAHRNGDADPSNPSMASIAEGFTTTGAKAALSAVGIPGPAGAAEMALIPRIAGQVGRDAAASAGSSAVDQLNTAGTVDPYQAAGAALQGGAARLASVAPSAAREGTQAASDQVMSRLTDQPASPEHAASIMRVAQMMGDATKAAADTSGPVPATTAANNVKSRIWSNLTGAVGDLRDIGVIGADAAAAAKRLITDRALRNNNAFTDNDALELEDALRGAPPEAVRGILQDARDLNTVSTQSFQKNTAGPLQQLGTTAGRLAMPVIELAHGNLGAAAGALVLGHGIGGKVGATVGRMGDNLLGLSKPPVVYQQLAARRALAGQAVGIPMQSATIRQAVGDVQAAQAAAAQRSAQTDAAYQARDLQNNPPPAPVSPAMAAQGAANDAMAQQAQAQTDAYLSGRTSPPPDPTGPIGRQTAAEIAAWQQQLANARARAKAAAAQQGVLNQAQAGQIDNLAQARLDAQTRAAAVRLQAAQQLPTPRADVPDMAQRAGVSQAMVDAARTLATARRLPGQSADRMDVGSPPTMGHPDGSPVMPDGTPLRLPQERPQWSPRAAPEAPQTFPATGTPGQAQASPSGAVRGPEGMDALPPPPAYLANHLMAKHGITLTPALFDQAIDGAVAAGRLNPQQGQHWRGYRGEMDNNVRDALTAQVAGIPSAQMGAVGLPAHPTVQRPLAYKLAADHYHGFAAELSQRATAAGMPALAAEVDKIRMIRTKAGKAQERDGFLAGLPSGFRSVAAGYLPDALVNHGA